MHDSEKVPVNVGVVPMGILKEWAQGSTRLTEVMSEESRFQQAVDMAQKETKERGVPEKYIEQIGSSGLCETIKENFLVIYVRAVAERFFQRKTEAEIESETLSNPEWLSKAVEEATTWIINSAVKAVKDFEAIERFMNLLAGEEEADDVDSDAD